MDLGFLVQVSFSLNICLIFPLSLLYEFNLTFSLLVTIHLSSFFFFLNHYIFHFKNLWFFVIVAYPCFIISYLCFIAFFFFRNVTISLKIFKYIILKAFQITLLSVSCYSVSFPQIIVGCWLNACLQENFST